MIAIIFTEFCHFSNCQCRTVEAFREVGPKLVRQLVAIYRLDKNHAWNMVVVRQICMLSKIRLFKHISTFSGWTLPCLDTTHKNTWTLLEVREYFWSRKQILSVKWRQIKAYVFWGVHIWMTWSPRATAQGWSFLNRPNNHQSTTSNCIDTKKVKQAPPAATLHYGSGSGNRHLGSS